MDTLFDTPYTIPDTKLVTRADRDTWSIDFTPKLADSETISSKTGFIEETSPDTINPVDGFVTNIDIDITGKFLYLSWDGSPLVPGHVYLLHAISTLNTTAWVELLTIVRCVG